MSTRIAWRAFALEQGHDGVALQDAEMNRLARGPVHAIDEGLGAAGQIDLAQAGMAERENARTEHVSAASRNLGDVAAADEGGQKVMAG